ncbi:MAG: 4Fe-4S cluster-binding domain-containing protein [Candidatus Omnitrophota bacterium]|nr:4Fe-4S cluster-binding domain-containing protein [Candidatus Omnitrophota bacterium]
MTSSKGLLEQETIEYIKTGRAPVIIFGAGVVGEALYYACSGAGIKITCFCDNNINKTKSNLCNLQVLHIQDLKSKYKEAVFLISAADIKDVISQLADLGYSKWYPGSLLLREFDVYQYQFSAPQDFVEYAVSTCIFCQDNYLSQDKLFLRSVDLIITERCSLKCKDCSNLMQYYQKPVDCDIKELLFSIESFCGIIDEVNEFRVIGGEPLMNKDFYLIMKRLIDEPKVRKIVVYTNGTIVPSQEQIEFFKNGKVFFIITDYGKLSKKLDGLIKALDQNKIACYLQKAKGWTNCAKIMEHLRGIEGQKEVFKNCCAKNTFTLTDGKLFRCPFSANSYRLRAVPDYEDDYVNILHLTGKGEDWRAAKNKIREFLTEKKFLQVCDFCNGRPFTAPAITPAIQAAKPLEYNIKKR